MSKENIFKIIVMKINMPTPTSKKEGRKECPVIYVSCPNIEASMYAQIRLRDTFGFQILNEGNEPHFSDRFYVCAPPQWAIEKGDKSVIGYMKPTMDIDGNKTYDETKNWINMIDALKFIKITESML